MTAATPAPPTDRQLTAAEYAALPDDGRRTELVLGKVVEMPPPGFRHGRACNAAGRLIGNYVAAHDLGWVVSNDSGVQTRRGPDTVRGPDVAFFSFARIPKDAPPDGYPDVAPELVVEVRSASNSWRAMHAKVNEYFEAGVKAVCVVDTETASVGVYTPDEFPRRLTADEELTLPEVFPDFRARVADFLG